MKARRLMLFILSWFSLLFFLYTRNSINNSITHNSNWPSISAQRIKDPAFNLTLNPDKKIVLLVTSFRGGSTFLGQIFDSNPAMQYLYEPFHEGHVRNLFKRGLLVGARPDHTISDLRMLYLQQILHNCTLFNTIIVQEKHAYCGTPEENLHRFNTAECVKPRTEGGIHHEVCQYRETTALKVIRLNQLADILKIRNIRTANIKIVHLLRNPLPMMKSRRTGWNYFMWDSMKMLEFVGSTAHENSIKESYESFEYCHNNMNSIAFVNNEPWLKDRYLRVTHTDMSLEPLVTAQKIYDFIGDELTDEVKNYIVNITGGDPAINSEDGKPKKRNPLEFRKNSAELVTQWENLDWYLKYSDLYNIESQCVRLMDLLSERFSVDAMSAVEIGRVLNPNL